MLKKTYGMTQIQFEAARTTLKNEASKFEVSTEENDEIANFTIKGVEGFYKWNNGQCTIRITSKPFLATWGIIESKIDEYMNTLCS